MPSQQVSLIVISLSFLLFTPLTASLPIPLPKNGSIQPSTLKADMQPRSPRMIPDQTDLLSHIFAAMGMDELNKFNKLRPEEHGDDTPIDDSHSTTYTVTSYDNETNKPGASDTGSVHGKEEATTTTTTITTTTSGAASPSASASASASASKGESESGSEGKDAAEDTDSFIGTLFEVLRKKFREALNSSDEVILR
ncbi:hypothetical protein BJY04DRAFT_220120 [Aspergillus karnatakaensis]|uniref:uncharacterized protein n=1 Tax=Aspergillus karnatakaensis TaxID=1810916 RepID=UPI003CCDCB5B